jgi:hypothetical protein
MSDDYDLVQRHHTAETAAAHLRAQEEAKLLRRRKIRDVVVKYSDHRTDSRAFDDGQVVALINMFDELLP